MRSNRLAFLLIVLSSWAAAQAQDPLPPYATPPTGKQAQQRDTNAPVPEPQSSHDQAVQQAQADEAMTGGPRRWDFSLRVFAEQNDNVPLITSAGGGPFVGDEKSVGAGIYADGDYR